MSQKNRKTFECYLFLIAFVSQGLILQLRICVVFLFTPIRDGLNRLNRMQISSYIQRDFISL